MHKAIPALQAIDYSTIVCYTSQWQLITTEKCAACKNTTRGLLFSPINHIERTQKMKKKNTETQINPNLNAQLAKPGKPGELTVLESFDTVLLPRHHKLDHLEAYRRFKGYRTGVAKLSAGSKIHAELTEGVSKDEPEAHFLEKKMLVIGTGGGEFGNPSQESRKESKAEKLALRLGIKMTTSMRKMNQTLHRLLEEDGSPTELPAIYRSLPRVIARHGIPDLHCYIGDAIQDGDIARLSRRPEEKGLQLYYNEWKAKEAPTKGYNDTKVISTLEKLIAESIQRRAKSNIELSYVVQCLFAKDKKKTMKAQETINAEKEKLIFNLISALYLNEVVYWQAVELCKAAERHRVLMTDRVEGKLKDVIRSAVFICADNPIIARASHHPEVDKIDVLVVKNPKTENVGIYINKDLPEYHHAGALWQMIQSLELLAMGWNPQNIPWKELATWRPHPEIEGIWSAHMRDMRIDNGLNKEGYRPTEIDPADILLAIQHVFDWRGGIDRWKRTYNLPVIRKSRRDAAPAQPASEAQPMSAEQELLKKIFEKPEGEPKTKEAAPKKPRAKKAKADKSPKITPPAEPSTAGKDFATAFAAAEAKKEEAVATA